MRYSEFRKRLLVGLMHYSEGNPEAYVELKDVADSFGLVNRNPGWIEQAAFHLKDEGYIQEAFSMDSGESGFDARITGAGIEAAEEFEQELIQSEPVKISSAGSHRPSSGSQLQNSEPDSSEEGGSRYFDHRTALFMSLVHAHDVLGPNMHPIDFALHETIDDPDPDLMVRAAIDLQNIGLAEFTYPNQTVTRDTLGGVLGSLTALGEQAYQSGEILLGLPESRSAVPASDRLVSVDHNQPEAAETLTTLEQFANEAEKSNAFGELFADPDERYVVLSEFRGGIELFRTGLFRKSTFDKLITCVLELAKNHAPGAVLGALATRALDLLAKLF